MTTKTVKIPNISCMHCTKTIQREVAELEGVTSVDVDTPSRMVTISGNKSSTDWESIAGL